MFDVDSSKGLHHNFAHLALPILVLMNPRKFYSDISDVNNEKYLKTIWQGLAVRMGVRQTPIELEVIKNVLREGTEVFIIKLPEPINVTDAFLVAALFQFNPSVKKEIESARYFTLEFGRSPYNQSIEYYLCEWTGSVISGRQHKNYGRLENTNTKSFVMAINEVLNTGKIVAHTNDDFLESKPKSIDEMSELEKAQFALEKILPAIREASLKQFAERDAVMKETMAYVERATKQRDRNIAIQKVFLIIITLIVLALIWYFLR